MAFEFLPALLPLAVGGTVDSTGFNQSQFETLVHELSHLMLGTKDKTWNTEEAYGAQRAESLAAGNSARSKKNAENWGIFVEACGVHESS